MGTAIVGPQLLGRLALSALVPVLTLVRLVPVLALGVLGSGLQPEADGGRVGLVRSHQVGEEPGGASDAQEQQAGGHGVEGASVAYTTGSKGAAQSGNDVM